MVPKPKCPYCHKPASWYAARRIDPNGKVAGTWCPSCGRQIVWAVEITASAKPFSWRKWN